MSEMPTKKTPRRIIIPPPEGWPAARFWSDDKPKYGAALNVLTDRTYFQIRDFLHLLRVNKTNAPADSGLTHKTAIIGSSRIVIPDMFSITKADRTGRNPQSYYLKSNPNRGSQYYGRIDADGSLSVTDEWLAKPELAELLNEIEDNPIEWFNQQEGKRCFVELMIKNNSRYGVAKIKSWPSVVLGCGTTGQRAAPMNVRNKADRDEWIVKTLAAWKSYMEAAHHNRVVNGQIEAGFVSWCVVDNETDSVIMRFPYTQSLNKVRDACDEWSSIGMETESGEITML